MMKKYFTVLICGLLALGVSACSSDAGSGVPKEKVFLKDDEVKQMYSSPKDFKGKYVTLTGMVFTPPETKDDTMVFQMWGDPKNGDKNTIVICDKNDVGDLKSDDYVKVTGYVEDEFTGDNKIGGKISAPQIQAEKVEKSSYIDVISPTKKEVTLNKVITQHGVSMTLNKVEFADTETRLYMSIENKSKDKFSFFSFNTKITQNSKQYEEESNFEANYQEIKNEILPSIKEEGIIAFKNIDQANFKLVCEGSSDNYSLDFTDFVFDVEVK